MSALITVQLICNGTTLDGQLCTVAWQPDYEDIDSATRQRRKARVAGWKVERKTGPRDLCPGEHLPVE